MTSERMTGSVSDSFGEYFRLPKTVGSVSADRLLDLAIANAELAHNQHAKEAAMSFHAAAGSAFVEAALMISAFDTEDAVSMGLDCLARGEKHLLEAADGQYHQLERGMTHPNQQSGWQRAEIQCDFIDVYHDMITGDISPETVVKIREQLDYRLWYANELKHDSGSDTGGLAHEVRMLKELWDTYEEAGDMIALPATARGGSGSSRAHETHDIVLSRQNEEGKWIYNTGVEIKGPSGKHRSILARYSSMLVLIDRGGGTRTFPAVNPPNQTT